MNNIPPASSCHLYGPFSEQIVDIFPEPGVWRQEVGTERRVVRIPMELLSGILFDIHRLFNTIERPLFKVEDRYRYWLQFSTEFQQLLATFGFTFPERFSTAEHALAWRQLLEIVHDLQLRSKNIPEMSRFSLHSPLQIARSRAFLFEFLRTSEEYSLNIFAQRGLFAFPIKMGRGMKYIVKMDLPLFEGTPRQKAEAFSAWLSSHNITHVRLDNYFVSCIPGAISRLPRLKSLTLVYVNLPRFPTHFNSASLKTLSVSCDAPAQPPAHFSLPKLRSFRLAGPLCDNAQARYQFLLKMSQIFTSAHCVWAIQSFPCFWVPVGSKLLT